MRRAHDGAMVRFTRPDRPDHGQQRSNTAPHRWGSEAHRRPPSTLMAGTHGKVAGSAFRPASDVPSLHQVYRGCDRDMEDDPLDAQATHVSRQILHNLMTTVAVQ